VENAGLNPILGLKWLLGIQSLVHFHREIGFNPETKNFCLCFGIESCAHGEIRTTFLIQMLN